MLKNNTHNEEIPAERDYLRHIAYDSVILGFSGDRLKILLMKYRNTSHYALPGGFVRRDENLEDAVRRGLKERTGLENIFLEQFHTFGGLSRYDPCIMQDILKAGGFDSHKGHWLLDRFISVAYYALINYEKVNLKADFLSESIDWYSIDEMPVLMQDHESIIEKALQVLRQNLDRKLIEMNILPALFTMKELQQVYESILGEKVRRSTFQRKMLNLGILKRHTKRYTGKAHKAPYLYSFLPISTGHY